MKVKDSGPAMYRELVKAVQRHGNFFPVPRALAASIGPMRAAVVMYLAGVGMGNATTGGWVMASTKFVQAGLGLSAERQERVLSGLAADGFLEMEHRGRMRFIRINVDAVRRELGLD